TISAMRIWPAYDVSGGINARAAGFQILVDHHAAIDSQTGLLGQPQGWPNAHTQHNKVGIERGTGTQRHFVSVDSAHRRSEMEDHAFAFMQAADKPADFRSHYSLQRLLLRSHYVHLEPTGSQRSSYFQPDKTAAYHYDLFG